MSAYKDNDNPVIEILLESSEYVDTIEELVESDNSSVSELAKQIREKIFAYNQ